MSDEYPKLKNGIKSLARIAKNKINNIDDKVPENIAKQRLAKCLICPFYNKAFQKRNKCGCFVNLKTQYKEEHCPIDKWSAHED